MAVTPAHNASLWGHIEQARWFSGKGRGGRLVGVTPLDWFEEPGGGTGPAVRPEIAAVEYPDGTREFYQLLISYRPEPAEGLIDSEPVDGLGLRHDATQDPEAMRQVVRAVLANRGTPTWRVTLNDALAGDLTPRLFGGQQSNTNVLLSSQALLKIFRKIEPGHNLDIEMHDALRSAGVRSIARLHGWVSAVLPDAPDTSFDLMMIVEQLQHAEDGWELACASARENTDFTTDAAQLGQALARVHRALAETFPTTTMAGSAVSRAMVDRLDQNVAAAPVLAPFRRALTALFAQVDAQRIPAQRVHGDFHLGQTLRVEAPAGKNPWRIIDFEGEPLRPLAQRRLPDSPWRDVAGLTRSFGYATSASSDPTGTDTQAWLRANRTAFLDAYSGGVGGGLGWAQRLLLLAYEADKAAYEVVYETRNRPDWVDIPLSGLQNIAEQASRAAG